MVADFKKDDFRYKDVIPKKAGFGSKVATDFRRNWPIYLLLLPVVVYFIIFSYIPMVGILMAFQNFNLRLGFFNSPWVGFQHFIDFFSSHHFVRVIRNTFMISFYQLLLFPAPIIFALLLNELRSISFKRVVQTISYMPFFISTVVFAGIVLNFFSSTGAMTQVISFFGGPSGNLIGQPGMFRGIFVGTGLWQTLGFSSIIYVAAIAGVDQELYEAARMDGAGRLRQTWHITLPGIAPTVTILLILAIGQLLNVGFERIILLYSPATFETGDVISSFVFRRGLLEVDYSFGAAVGLFNSVVAFVLIIGANFFARRYSETSLF